MIKSEIIPVGTGSLNVPDFHTNESPDVSTPKSKPSGAMIEHGVKGELHIYRPGSHGMGLAKPLEHIDRGDTDYCSSWPKLLKNWIINMI